jgi:2-dehydropantoate 2-reductase
MDGRLSQRADQIGQAIAKSKGVTVHVSQNILAQLWRKFMLIAPWSGVGALTRSPIGVIRSLPETRELLLDSIREVFEVAQASGIEIEEKAVNDTIDFIDQLPPEGSASMQRDIMDGLPSELNEQSGAIVRYGKIVGVQTPVNRFIYHSLLPLEQKARGE